MWQDWAWKASLISKFYCFCRLFQPAHIVIDFILNDGSGKANSQEASDVLVLNLELLAKSQSQQHDCIETVSKVPFCYTSILHVR